MSRYRDDWRVKHPKSLESDMFKNYVSGLTSLNAAILIQIAEMIDKNVGIHAKSIK